MTSERFWTKVRKTSKCWIWTGMKDGKGYGRVHWNGRTIGAHRLAHILSKGEIPKGLVIDHLCRNTVCVNPAHLEAVSNGENIFRGTNPIAEKRRQTHCIHGHEFCGRNLYIHRAHNRAPRRQCRECRRLALQRKFHRNMLDPVFREAERIRKMRYRMRHIGQPAPRRTR